MSKPLRVLLVEDSQDDAELIERHLRKGGYEPVLVRVEDAASMRAALAEPGWDLIISDWTVPSFGALDALDLYREIGVDLPFLIVSGTIGEERAAQAMRAGAHDLVLKDRLARLVPAVEREMTEARRRAEQRALREELRASQETLARSTKLRALGQMAAGISHDLKNILNPISLHLQFLRRAIARGQTAEAEEAIAEMDQVLRRGVQTIERLREFSRQAPESKAELIDLNRLTHEAVEIARARLSSRPAGACSIREELGDPPRVLARASDVVSAVVNLVVNAIDAVTDGCTIVLRTGKARGGAWVEVSDDGPGMTPEVEQRAFEPFFTTKGEDGTGLGLPMVYACAERHNGSISLETAPGKGARFTLWLPGTAAAS